MHIGQIALQRVIEYETNHDRKPEPQEHANPGFDVKSYTLDGESLLRYIEVKGIGGPWGVRGVTLSSFQYDFAKVNPDNFWLYVVEYALDDEEYKVHTIPNPIEEITHYRFDHGWRSLAKTEENEEIQPAIGMNIRFHDDWEGNIVHIDGGERRIKRLTIHLADGKEIVQVYRPTDMILSVNKAD
jgi:hypothetical protein